MMGILKLAIPALLSSLCNASANALWKSQLSAQPLSLSSVPEFIHSVFTLKIMGGVICYGVSMLLFFYILSNYRLSQAVPFLATTYIFNFILAVVVFHEPLVINQIIGIILIVVGVICSNL